MVPLVKCLVVPQHVPVAGGVLGADAAPEMGQVAGVGPHHVGHHPVAVVRVLQVPVVAKLLIDVSSIGHAHSCVYAYNLG